MIKGLLYVLLSLSAIIGCKSSDKVDNASPRPTKHNSSLAIKAEDWSQTTKVVYRFGDSSLPPDYHRSYTIVITADKMSITFDSYGKELLNRDYPNTAEAFKAFIDELSKTGIKKNKAKDNPCTGGTTESLKLYKGDECYLNGYAAECSGDIGSLIIPYGVSELIGRQLPEDVNELRNSTMKQ